MFSLHLIRISLVLAITTIVPATLRAQCLDWRAFPEKGTETDGAVRRMCVHDDGTGPALYVFGTLRSPQFPHAAVSILRWNGSEFSEVGSGLKSLVS